MVLFDPLLHITLLEGVMEEPLLLSPGGLRPPALLLVGELERSLLLNLLFPLTSLVEVLEEQLSLLLLLLLLLPPELLTHIHITTLSTYYNTTSTVYKTNTKNLRHYFTNITYTLPQSRKLNLHLAE